MTPRDVYLVTAHEGRDVTRKRKGTGDVHTAERRRYVSEITNERLAICCNEDVVKKRIENVEDVAKCISIQRNSVSDTYEGRFPSVNNAKFIQITSFGDQKEKFTISLCDKHKQMSNIHEFGRIISVLYALFRQF